MVKESGHGFVLWETEWEMYLSAPLGDLSNRTIQKVQFVANSRPPGGSSKYKNTVCTKQMDLPSHLLGCICQSDDHYNAKINKVISALGKKAKTIRRRRMVLNPKLKQ